MNMKASMKKVFLCCLLPAAFMVAAQAVAQNKNTENIAFIIGIGTDNASIQADYVQMLTGTAAVAAARKRGEAEYDINAKADTNWYVPNDYYIVNENPKIRKLSISTDVKIYLVKAGTATLGKSNIAELRQFYQGKLFRLASVGGKVVAITEIYTP